MKNQLRVIQILAICFFLFLIFGVLPVLVRLVIAGAMLMMKYWFIALPVIGVWYWRRRELRRQIPKEPVYTVKNGRRMKDVTPR